MASDGLASVSRRLRPSDIFKPGAVRQAAIAFGFAAGASGMMISNSSAGQRIALDCQSVQAGTPGEDDISGPFCAALAQHLTADLGLTATPGDGPGHKIALRLKSRSPRSTELTITTAPLKGGAEKSVKSVLVSHDGKITGFSARTLVAPIARQLGLIK